MSVLAIIPIRYHSARFPGKAMHIFGGKPISEWVYRVVCKAESIDKIIIATDDHRIKLHFEDLGAEVFYSEVQHNCGTDRCAEVVKKYPGYSLILNIQGDEIGMKKENIDLLIENMNGQSPDAIGTLKFKLSDQIENAQDPNLVKVVCGSDHKALYFSRLPIPYNYSGNQSNYNKHIGVYAYLRNCLLDISKLSESPLEKREKLEQLRWLENGYDIFAFDALVDSHSVNVKTDLEGFEL